MDILLVEDNENIISGLEYAFSKNNYNLVSKTNMKSAVEYLNVEKPELIILDVSLPDGNGFDLYKSAIKEKEIPVIFLTARDDEDDVIKGLSLGAEDYMTKPFSTKELLVRVKNIILRNNKISIINVKDISFHLNKMIVSKNGKEIDLTSLELKILHLLFNNIGKVVRRNTILDKIWEWTGNDVDNHTITVYLKRIREKL
jgi:DNA-binding response OmpR family regulator